MAAGLVRAGHEVTVLTEVPNHPRGIVERGYRWRLWKRTRLDGIDVVHVWVKASPAKTFAARILFYASYMVMATLAGIVLARGKYDVIYCTSPPLFVGGAGLALGVLRRAPLIFEVRDLWPESAVRLGELRSRRAIRWATRLEEICYRRARHIVVTGREMLEHLTSRGIAPDRISWIPNGANPDLFRFDPEERCRVRRELGVEGKFVVIYAGLMGVAQGLDRVLEAAALLCGSAPEVHWVFLGEGPAKAALLARARELGLSSATFLPEVPRPAVPAFLSAADVALVPVRVRLTGLLPSKMFDAMVCERAVVLAAEGEAGELLREAEAGIRVPPNDPEAIAHAVLALRDDPIQREAYGRAGRATVVASYSRAAQAAKLARLLEEVLAGASA